MFRLSSLKWFVLACLIQAVLIVVAAIYYLSAELVAIFALSTMTCLFFGSFIALLVECGTSYMCDGCGDEAFVDSNWRAFCCGALLTPMAAIFLFPSL
jgi:hypothetical protein